MKELPKVFSYESYQVRTVLLSGEPWFVAKDVCDILDLTDGRKSVELLDEDERNIIPVIDAMGREQQSYVINEPGLYSLVIKSRKPEAKMFKRWITHEVIPAIRKNGAYMTPETIEKVLSNPDTIIELATRLKEEQQKRLSAEKVIEDQKPLVMFAESCIASNDSILVRELAKLASKNGVCIGEKRLYKKLREWGLVLTSKNEPSQYGMELCLFEVKKGVYQTPYGSETYQTLKVTPRGQVYIMEKLKKEAA